MKVEVDTDKLRFQANAEFERARDRHADAIRLIEAIERLPSSQGAEPARPEAAPNEEWDGIRNAIRVFGRGNKEITAFGVLDFIGSRYPQRPQITLTQIASAMRKMMVIGELNRLRAATASSEAIYEFADRSEQGGES